MILPHLFISDDVLQLFVQSLLGGWVEESPTLLDVKMRRFWYLGHRWCYFIALLWCFPFAGENFTKAWLCRDLLLIRDCFFSFFSHGARRRCCRVDAQSQSRKKISSRNIFPVYHLCSILVNTCMHFLGGSRVSFFSWLVSHFEKTRTR